MSLATRIRESSRLEGSFTLRSGLVSDTYFDKYQFESDPVLLNDIAAAMAESIPAGTELLCGLELGGVPVVTMLSHITGIPAAFIRKTPKTYGTCKYAEGPVLGGKKLLLVEDVVSSGGAVLDATTMMRADGHVVTDALCVIDRRPEGVTSLEEAGVQLKALLTMAEIERG